MPAMNVFNASQPATSLPRMSVDDARAYLGTIVAPGSTVYGVLRHRTPHQTVIDPFVLSKGRLVCVRGAVAAVLRCRLQLRYGGVETFYTGTEPTDELARDLAQALCGENFELRGETL